MATTPFLARLQLDTDADARAIRRAYARELKQIDQAADPAGFQVLRECYERALAWAEHVARAAAAPVSSPATPAAAPQAEALPASAAAAPAVARAADAALQSAPHAEREASAPPPDAAALAQAVFAELCAAIPTLLAAPGEPDIERWVAALRQALADPRLELLEAHERFEAHLAHLLAAGWRPGHEWLLPAAVRVFGWEADRRALRRLQRDGMLLDAALDQQAVFDAQDAPVRARQREVLAMLRKPAPPSEQLMSNLVMPLRTMAGRFPHWLGLVAPAGAVRHWLESCAQAEAPRAGAAATGDVPKLNMGRKPGAIGAVVLMLWLLSSVFRHFGDAPTYSSQPPNPDTARIMEQARRQPPPLPQDQPLTREQAEAIQARIRYKPSPGTPAGQQDTKLEVYLDDQGNMVGVKWLKRSSDPAFSDAVEKALHDSGPYPRQTERVFAIGYKVDVSIAHKPGRPMRKPAPWEPLRPEHPAPRPAPWLYRDLPSTLPSTSPDGTPTPPQTTPA